MMEMFGFNPNALSDEELMDRITELTRRIVWASRNSSGDLVWPLQQQKLHCEAIQRERRMAPMLNARLTSPAIVVESDPDLAAAQKTELEVEAAKLNPLTPRPKPFGGSRERIKASMAPLPDPSDQPK